MAGYLFAPKFLATMTMKAYLTFILPKEDDVGIQERLTTTVSTKGQVILPKAIRDQRHWPPGTRLTVEDTAEGVLLKATPAFAAASIDTVYGSMKPAGPALSVDDMNAVIAREAKRRARD